MRERVHEYLLRRPAGAPAAELLDLMFTRPGSDAELGERFLFTLLGADPRFAYRSAAGHWVATAHERLALPLSDAAVVVVDLETTGGSAQSGDAIIEIGAARLAAGQVVERFQRLVDPRRPLPPFITRLTGISDTMLRGQPGIETVLAEFLDFASTDVLVAHNAAFDISFLDAAARRVRGSGLAQPHLCTLRLARRLLPQLRRRSLDSLAGHLGIPVVDRHRALGDALMTAEVYFHFLELAQKRGVSRLDELLDFQYRAGDGRHFTCALPRSTVAALSDGPGIYRFSGEGGRLLYIGKAKSLRQRVGSYLGNASGHSRKTLDLIRNIRDVTTVETGSELEASLLEAEEIRRCQPPYNRLRKHLPQVAFLKLGLADPFPRLSLATRPGSGRARFFGPFRGRAEAQRALDVLARAFALRTCTGRLRPEADFPACFHGQIGVCSSPCNGGIDDDAYGERVRSLLAFFAGEPGALRVLEERRDSLAAGEHFEAAARQQREIDFAEKLRRRQQQLGWIVERQHFAVVQPGGDGRGLVVYIVAHGRLVERAHLRAATEITDLVERVSSRLAIAKAAPLRAEEVDGTTILAAWLRDRGERDGYVLPIAAADSGPVDGEDAAGRLPEWAAALRELLATGADPNRPAAVAAAGEHEQHWRQQDQPQIAQ